MTLITNKIHSKNNVDNVDNIKQPVNKVVDEK